MIVLVRAVVHRAVFLASRRVSRLALRHGVKGAPSVLIPPPRGAASSPFVRVGAPALRTPGTWGACGLFSPQWRRRAPSVSPREIPGGAALRTGIGRDWVKLRACGGALMVAQHGGCRSVPRPRAEMREGRWAYAQVEVRAGSYTRR